MSESGLAVSRSVIRDLVGLAALEVPGVLRVGWAGPPWRHLFSGRADRASASGTASSTFAWSSSPGPARRWGRLPRTSDPPSPAPWSACSASSSAR